ncbi:hypothetical protein ACSQ67_009646 [Phaseolus vulgaris]
MQSNSKMLRHKSSACASKLFALMSNWEDEFQLPVLTKLLQCGKETATTSAHKISGYPLKGREEMALVKVQGTLSLSFMKMCRLNGVFGIRQFDRVNHFFLVDFEIPSHNRLSLTNDSSRQHLFLSSANIHVTLSSHCDSAALLPILSLHCSVSNRSEMSLSFSLCSLLSLGQSSSHLITCYATIELSGSLCAAI